MNSGNRKLARCRLGGPALACFASIPAAARSVAVSALAGGRYRRCAWVGDGSGRGHLGNRITIVRHKSTAGVSCQSDLCFPRRVPLPLSPDRAGAPIFTMLFKAHSASVYGIDAYLVEVEVDVGSARMNDFNVVGLPDNAVKESRERIKSALRNCGYEFPYGQGVTINLAPADVRKEGSGFDLPMALGLVGCQGQFFGKQLDKMMFLGALPLYGSVLSVLGALSAALAARGVGVKWLPGPYREAEEAALARRRGR